MEERTVRITSITCSHCVQTIRRELGEIDGIESVDASPVTRTATIRWQSPATWEIIRRTLEEIGYSPEE